MHKVLFVKPLHLLIPQSYCLETLKLLFKCGAEALFLYIYKAGIERMELKTVVYYRNAYAHFVITREHKGVYCADLLEYDGLEDNAPPSCVILVRGERKWWGSAADDELVYALSEAITALPESDLFYKEHNTSTDLTEESI